MVVFVFVVFAVVVVVVAFDDDDGAAVCPPPPPFFLFAVSCAFVDLAVEMLNFFDRFVVFGMMIYMSFSCAADGDLFPSIYVGRVGGGGPEYFFIVRVRPVGIYASSSFVVLRLDR